MAITLTDADFIDLLGQAEQQGKSIRQPIENGVQCNWLQLQQFGQGGELILQLRQGLEICIRRGRLRYPVRHLRQHESNFPLVAKFYLSGTSRIRTLDAIDIDRDYREMAGYHYLYHLPDHTEVEEWPADRETHVIMIFIDPDYFGGFNLSRTTLPRPLQHLLTGDRTQRFHQSLGRITNSIRQQIQQILDCPYTGLMQQLYLESKALELVALQFACLETDSPASKPFHLSASDLDRVQYAREILIQQICSPPSLAQLAHQAGLNEFALKQGFRHLFGTTVFGHLRDYRMQQAKMMLCVHDVTVAQVASQVGYRNPEAFSTAFRRKFSVSPKAYQLGRRN
ncbi:MAG: AraC family transcriptional regulator [Cyanobacteria bacterium P01_A01_bin.17]